MARQRFIWPDLWTDPTVGVLDPLERLLFIALFSLADDEGRIDGSPAYLKAAAFPYDAFSIADVEQLRDSLVGKHENVILYHAGEVDVIALLKWTKRQRPKYAKPSKLPAPPEKNRRKSQNFKKDSRNVPPTLGERSSNAGGTLGEDSGNAGGSLPERWGTTPSLDARASAQERAAQDLDLRPKTEEQGQDQDQGTTSLSPDKPATAATIRAIFHHWKAARGKARAGLTDQRRRKIQSRLKRFTPDELRAAIDAVSLDPWEERSRHDDLTVLFRSDEQVEKFLELADRANGSVNGAGPEAAARERERRHLDAVAAREGRL